MPDSPEGTPRKTSRFSIKKRLSTSKVGKSGKDGSASESSTPRETETPREAEKAAPSEDEAATKMQSRFRGSKARKSRESRDKFEAKAEKSVSSGGDEDAAAAKIQAHAKKRRMTRISDGASHVAQKIHDKKDDLIEKKNEKVTEYEFAAVNKAVKVGLSIGIKQALSTDPWIPSKLAKVIEGPTIELIEEVSSRAMANQLEKTGKGSRKLVRIIRDQLEPTNWPDEPNRAEVGTWAWARAKYLYAINAADKSFCYLVFHKQSMLVPWVCTFACPQIFPLSLIALLTWLFYAACIWPYNDEFQLFNYIATFKTYAFVFCGFLPLVADFFLFYFYLTSEEVSAATDYEHNFFQIYGMYVNRLYIINCVVCIAIYELRYKKVRKSHYVEGSEERSEDNAVAGAEAKGIFIHTGDLDTGDREQHYLMLYDKVVLATHMVFSVLDLKFRLGVDFQDSIFAPSQQTILLEGFVVTSLSLFSLPFILWKMPQLGELFHQLRPTGFDQAGHLRLAMTLAQMKRKKHKEDLLTGDHTSKISKVGAAIGKGAGAIAHKTKRASCACVSSVRAMGSAPAAAAESSVSPAKKPTAMVAPETSVSGKGELVLL